MNLFFSTELKTIFSVYRRNNVIFTEELD